MGVMLSAAGSFRWFRDALAPDVDFGELAATAGTVPAGSEGLLFLPYLTGERTPHPDPLARGAFVGLTVRHGREHMTRSVLEGVSFGLRDSFELIRAAGGADLTEVRASGGGTRSPVWRQILADVLDAEVRTVATAEGAAQGAAILAAVGAGWFDDAPEASTAWLQSIRRPLPVRTSPVTARSTRATAASIRLCATRCIVSVATSRDPRLQRLRSLASPPEGTMARPEITDRDLYVDFLRAFSLVVVVIWHWGFTILGAFRSDGSPTNPIGFTRGMWAITWVLQVMPVFFFVGGYTHRLAFDDYEPGDSRRFLRKRASGSSHRSPSSSVCGSRSGSSSSSRWIPGHWGLARCHPGLVPPVVHRGVSGVGCDRAAGHTRPLAVGRAGARLVAGTCGRT